MKKKVWKMIGILIVVLTGCNKKIEILDPESSKKCSVTSVSNTNWTKVKVMYNDSVVSNDSTSYQINTIYSYVGDTLTESITSDSSGAPFLKLLFYYDNKGRVNKIITKLLETDIIEANIKFTYNNILGKIESVRVGLGISDLPISLESTAKFTYNSSGQLKRRDLSVDSLTSNYTIYNYDNAGNIVSDTTYTSQYGQTAYISSVNNYEFDTQTNYVKKFNSYLLPEELPILNPNNILKTNGYKAVNPYLPADTTIELQYLYEKNYDGSYQYFTDEKGNLNRTIYDSYFSFSVTGLFVESKTKQTFYYSSYCP